MNLTILEVIDFVEQYGPLQAIDIISAKDIDDQYMQELFEDIQTRIKDICNICKDFRENLSLAIDKYIEETEDILPQEK